MFNLFNLAPEDMVWFYLAPIAIFGPIFFLVLWNFGLKNIFHTPPEIKEQQRQERAHAERINQRRERKAGRHTRRENPAGRPSWYWVGQALVYGVFAFVIGGLSAWPEYTYTDAREAQIKLSLSHPGQRIEDCRRRTAAELRELAPNMRATMDCSRARWPVEVVLMLDGRDVFHGRAEPAGLRDDGASSFYEKFHVAAGSHTLHVRMNDAGPDADDTHAMRADVTLAPGQNLVIGFRENDGFYLK